MDVVLTTASFRSRYSWLTQQLQLKEKQAELQLQIERNRKETEDMEADESDEEGSGGIAWGEAQDEGGYTSMQEGDTVK